MKTFVDFENVASLETEAATLAHLATQAVSVALVQARDVERLCFKACADIAIRDQQERTDANPYCASPELMASLDALHQSTKLRKNLEGEMRSLLDWCKSVQGRHAIKTHCNFTGTIQ